MNKQLEWANRTNNKLLLTSIRRYLECPSGAQIRRQPKQSSRYHAHCPCFCAGASYPSRFCFYDNHGTSSFIKFFTAENTLCERNQGPFLQRSHHLDNPEIPLLLYPQHQVLVFRGLQYIFEILVL